MEGEEIEKGIETLFKEIISEDFPNLEKDMDNLVQNIQKTPSKIKPKKTTLRHILIKMLKSQGQGDNFESNKSKMTHYI